MNKDDIIEFIELFSENWQLAFGVLLTVISATYFFALIKALGAEHGKQIANNERSEIRNSSNYLYLYLFRKIIKLKFASRKALSLIKRNYLNFGLPIIFLSVAVFWLLTRSDPCFKPASQMTIQEKIQCERQ